MEENRQEQQQEQLPQSPIPVILFITMILGGVLMAFFGDIENDMQRFCFVVMISLGAGLGAAYLTGQISGGGIFGFINVRSATGGFLVWLIVLAAFFYFFPKVKVVKDDNIQKYYNLATLSEFEINATFITQDNSIINITREELYYVLDNVIVERSSNESILKINFKFSERQINDYRKFFFSFGQSFRSQIAPSIHQVEGWHSSSAGNGEISYYPNDKKLAPNINFQIKLNL